MLNPTFSFRSQTTDFSGVISIQFYIFTLLKQPMFLCREGKKIPSYLLVCLTFKVFFFSPSLPVLYLMSKSSKNRCVHHSTKCRIFSRLEASVIVRDTFLADSAISARTDSTSYKRRILMAVLLASAIPPGRWMEILPVTRIQASASAKQMLLVRVMQKFTVTSLLPSGIKFSVRFLNWRVKRISWLKAGWKRKKKKQFGRN